MEGWMWVVLAAIGLAALYKAVTWSPWLCWRFEQDEWGWRWLRVIVLLLLVALPLWAWAGSLEPVRIRLTSVVA